MEKNLFVIEDEGDALLDDAPLTQVKEEVVGLPSDRQEEEDPIVQEIPINLTHGPCPIYILQYLNKSLKLGRRIEDHPSVAEVRYKEKSNVLELDMPLNTDVFFNQDRAKEQWDGVQVQTLRGVGVENAGQYVGLMHDGQMYLMPVERVAQLKPYFKYIDQEQQKQRKQDDNITQGGSAGSNPRAQVVTMSAKSSSEANQNRLGGSLLAHKIAEDEPVQTLAWKEDTFENFLAEVTSDEAREALVSEEDAATYLAKLI
ncbi:AaceriAFR083Wp [[Ashbya] aceris (nom. inval.)]|nr:AaceriAFR083Wp [[Ashbya] aceris (nom. inval.)]